MLPTVPENLDPVTRGRTRMVQSSLRHLSPDERAQLLQEGASDMTEHPVRSWASDWVRTTLPALTIVGTGAHVGSRTFSPVMAPLLEKLQISAAIENAEIMSGIERILEHHQGYGPGQEAANQYRQRLSEAAQRLTPGSPDSVAMGDFLRDSRLPEIYDGRDPLKTNAWKDHISSTTSAEIENKLLDPSKQPALWETLGQDGRYLSRWRLRGAPEADLVAMGMSPKTRGQIYNLVREGIQGDAEGAMRALERKAVNNLRILNGVDRARRLISYGVAKKSLPILAPLAALYGAVKATQAKRGYGELASTDHEGIKNVLRRRDEAQDVGATHHSLNDTVQKWIGAVIPDFLGG